MINRIFFACIGIGIILYVYKKVSKNKIAEKESIFWMVGAIGIFYLSLFPQTIDIFAKGLGIYYPPSMLFMLGILFCLILILRLTMYVSVLQQQTKELAQNNAILNKELEEMKEQIKKTNRGD